ncbi:MAG: hypothetical protein ACOCQX_01275 [Candidatus Nanoarchaeia archaeon]
MNMPKLHITNREKIKAPEQKISSNPLINKVMSYLSFGIETILGVNNALEVEQISYISPVQTRFPENNIGKFRHYKAESDSSVLIFPQRGEGYNFAQLLSMYLASNGINAYEVETPLRSSRLPSKVKSMSELDLSIEDLVNIGQQAVSEGQGIITEMNESMKATAGISLGGIYSSILYGIDNRLTSACLMVTGGNLKQMVTQSEDALAKSLCDYSNLDYLNYIDPCFYTNPGKAGSLLMINAKYDRDVLQENGYELAISWGEPNTIYIRAGHLSAVKNIFHMFPEIKNHFEKTLGK